MTPTGAPKSTGEMMTDIMANVGNLVRNEVDLARAELSGSLKKASGALGMIGVAAVLAIAGVNLLAAALVTLVIAAGMSPQWATTLVGVGLLVVGLLVFMSARSTLNHIGFVPTRTARNLQRDAAAIKEAYNDN